MKNIVLARIDDRLIHGQVVVSWLKHTKANEIVVIDEEIAKDEFLKKIVTAAAPNTIKSIVLTEKESMKYLKENGDSEKIILLSKTPQVFQRLIEGGIKLKKINLGGVGHSKERKSIYRSISLSEEEINCLKNIEKSGTKVEIQIVPTDRINKLNNTI